MRTEASGSGPEAVGAAFATTHWSVVLAASEEESPEAAQALERLCRCYWFPLYVYVRRRGYGPDDAQDLTQEFFARFLRKRGLLRANPARGKFRTFLLHAMQNFLTNEWKRARTAKRGGTTILIHLDAQDAERRYTLEPATSLTPERAFEKRWATTLLEQVLADLELEYTKSGQGGIFGQLSDLLWGKEAGVSYAEIGNALGMNEGAVRGAMHRLRERYRERLRLEVAQTVEDFREVDEELHYLISAVAEPG